MPEAAASSPVDDSAKEQMPTMGFLDHLEELRKRIVYSIIAIVVGFFACWGYRREHLRHHAASHHGRAAQHNGLSAKLVYLNPIEPFNLYLKVGGMAGLFVASPFVLYQIWCFISPGLYRNEKRYVMPFMALDRSPVPGRRILRLQARLPAGARVPDRLRQSTSSR